MKFNGFCFCIRGPKNKENEVEDDADKGNIIKGGQASKTEAAAVPDSHGDAVAVTAADGGGGDGNGHGHGHGGESGAS
ncbi:uncharacterized protein DS421_18g605560 [Arachis hypogaea]|nr:uncharacterized protein DS421_18g605560 [Arachis hypogaea]